jgi:hypothetical protein
VAAVSGKACIGKLVSLIRLLTPPPKINESQRINERPETAGTRRRGLLSSARWCKIGATRIPREGTMLTIRLQKSDWGNAWRAMIEIGPVRLIADDPIYEVLLAHLELLTARGFSYEVVQRRSIRQTKHRHGVTWNG